MKKLGKDDLYRHIDQFLKEKGIELRDAAPLGRGLQKGCQAFTDAINSAQAALEKARNRMDGGIDKMRDIVHKKTAPRKKAKAPKSTPKRKKSRLQQKRQPQRRQQTLVGLQKFALRCINARKKSINC